MHYSTSKNVEGRGAAQAGRGMPSDVARYAASDCLLERLRDALKQPGVSCLEIRDQGRIWIDSDSGRYFAEIDSPPEFFSMPGAALKLSGGRALNPDWPARTIDELLYQSAWYGPENALLEDCHPFDVICLRYWPNFTRLPHTRHVLLLSSLLSRRPTSLTFAYRMMRIPEADALRFYSAVTAAGYVRTISAQPKAAAGDGLTESAEAASAGNFWSRLFERISGL